MNVDDDQNATAAAAAATAAGENEFMEVNDNGERKVITGK